MKVVALTLLSHRDPSVSARDRLLAAGDLAVTVEELGLDGFAVGEHHNAGFVASSPAVVLAHVAARTSRVRLLTGVTVLSLLDPVRVAEEYATLDQLSGGRLDLIIGKGNTELQSRVFGYTNDDQWERLTEKYELLRRLWREEDVHWSGTYRPALDGVTTYPRPLQSPPRTWHGSATSRVSTELAARWGDPLFSANVSGELAQYKALVDDYRERWAAYGRDPADALVGAGSSGLFVARTSQEALATYRPVFDAGVADLRAHGVEPQFGTLEDAVERGSLLVGSPQQVVDKVGRYHEALGHEVLHTGDNDRLDPDVHRGSLELFAAEVLPVLRTLPSRPWGPVLTDPADERPADGRAA